MTEGRVGGSFRDPDGFLFVRDGVLLRQINATYRDDWEELRRSGLLQRLSSDQLLIPHETATDDTGLDGRAIAVIAPQRIPFISYPYEWSPSQVRDAALLTLRVQQEALRHEMTLKDASAFNVQFIGHRAIHIDTLSFTRYRDGDSWMAYRQFCQHFLAPLALMVRCDPRLRDLGRSFLDGIPLDLASRLLPRSSWLSPALLVHLHLHARSIQQHADKPVPERIKRRGVSRDGLLALLGHLERAISGLRWQPQGTEWSDYEASHNYTAAGQEAKETAIRHFAAAQRPELVFDLGANAGHYSHLLQQAGAYVVAMDADVGAVEALHRRLLRDGTTGILPLWVDLTNPAPAQGWGHQERDSLAARGPADLLLALALVHHLAIGNNIPLPAIAAYLAQLGRSVVLEWVPKDDPQVGRLLTSRPDIFADYSLEAMIAACAPWFEIGERVAVPGSNRILLMMVRR